MKFDWYQATIAENPQHLAETLAEGLKATLESTRGMYGYTNGFEVRNDKGTIARILCGGVNLWPNAWASGENAPAFVDFVRARWPNNHHVTRMDVCDDIAGTAETWDRLYKVCVDVADELELIVEHQGDYHGKTRGRTLYVGSRKSPVRVRLYEKGKQLRCENPGSASEYPENWVRIEAQIRPDKETRDIAAGLSALDAWGLSKATCLIAERGLGASVPRLNAARWKKSDDEKALEHMCLQYGKMLTRLRLRGKGGWMKVGVLIGKTIERVQAQRQKVADEI